MYVCRYYLTYISLKYTNNDDANLVTKNGNALYQVLYMTTYMFSLRPVFTPGGEIKSLGRTLVSVYP
jgi:hypothetical protein